MTRAALQQALLVGAGGFIGSVLRYAVSGWVQRLDASGSFPYGTLAVNAIGCAVIGVLGGLAVARQVLGPEMRLFVFIGVLGGFTTFSTFGYETVTLLADGDFWKSGTYVLTMLAVCLTAAWLGYAAAGGL